MKASIIIPSYNSKERLYYNLLSLNNQDYDFNEFEVVVVDNGSTDDTISMLMSFMNQAKFKLKFARLEKNRGIACGRNAAIKMSEGDILIFHDSDMIAPKDFVRRHLGDHEEKNIVVCGISWKRIISFYYQELENKGEGYKGLIKLKSAPIKIEKAPILDERLILTGEYMDYAFDLEEDFIKEVKGILEKYDGDLSKYALPWRLFITNNASVEREKVMNVGMFDESIVAYGFEDYDLGIRLFKSGCKFMFDKDILNIHQEHPSNIRIDEFKDNIRYICNKYNSIYFIDVILVCVGYLTSIDDSHLNELVCEINKMIKSVHLTSILETFLKLLQILRTREFNDEWSRSILNLDIKDINPDIVAKQMITLKNFYGLKYFTKAMASLLDDVYK